MGSGRRARLPVAAASAAVMLTLACPFARGQQPGGDQAQLDALRAEIVRLIGDARCVNVVHCRLLALGTRPCGGADEYLAYSSHTADRTALENNALEYALIQEDLQRAKSLAGICVVVPEPRLACVDRRCRVVAEQ